MAPCCCGCIGCYFHPTDSELVGYYLLNKAIGNPIRNEEKLVPTTILYGEKAKEPATIWRDFDGERMRSGEDIYFFTTLKTMKTAKGKKGGSTSSRLSRKAGDHGCWHEVAAVSIGDGLGMKKRFKYKPNAKANNQDGGNGVGWIMFEFSLKDYPIRGDRDQDLEYVLCQLKKNDKSGGGGGGGRVVGTRNPAPVLTSSESTSESTLPLDLSLAYASSKVATTSHHDDGKNDKNNGGGGGGKGVLIRNRKRNEDDVKESAPRQLGKIDKNNGAGSGGGKVVQTRNEKRNYDDVDDGEESVLRQLQKNDKNIGGGGSGSGKAVQTRNLERNHDDVDGGEDTLLCQLWKNDKNNAGGSGGSGGGKVQTRKLKRNDDDSEDGKPVQRKKIQRKG